MSKIILASCVSVFSSQWETNIGFSPWLKKELFFFQGAHKHYSDCILIKHESEFCVKGDKEHITLLRSVALVPIQAYLTVKSSVKCISRQVFCVKLEDTIVHFKQLKW